MQSCGSGLELRVALKNSDIPFSYSPFHSKKRIGNKKNERLDEKKMNTDERSKFIVRWKI